MAFHQRSWDQRLDKLGDEGESVYEDVFPLHHRCGLNRPPFGMSGMNVDMRSIPDYMEREAFVEVMGIGHDLTLKLKVEKIQSLLRWEQIGPVDLFVWSRKQKSWYRANVRDWFKAALQHGTHNAFHDGNEYIAIKTINFPSEGTPYVPSVEAA